MNIRQNNQSLIHPVILCGGSGTRLWPLSRQDVPKQFLPLVSDQSLLQDTVCAVSDADLFTAPSLIANKKFNHLISRQLEEIGQPGAQLIMEPEGRNTAPAIALAALVASETDPDACLLVLPSDHVIDDHDAFLETIQTAANAARQGALVTFGIKADRPETGYGYIAAGSALEEMPGAARIDHFIEKPDQKKAEELIRTGGYYWNSGMFMFTARRILKELGQFNNVVVSTCNAALASGTRAGRTIHPDAGIFSRVENISIDYAVMEHTRSAAVVPATFGWCDIGSWQALAELDLDTITKDGAGNTRPENSVFEDCSGTYIHSDTGRTIAAIGMDNFMIVDTQDALLVAPLDRSQDVKEVVSELAASESETIKSPAIVQRPWGSYEGIHQGKQHQVKHIVVAPGGKLSAQFHHHRSEHWILVSGMADVMIGDTTSRLVENERVYIPQGSVHRLSNPTDEPLHLIEVQYGDYLGEDDIVRIDDIYGRVSESVPAVAAE